MTVSRRLTDIFVSFALLVVLSPVFLAIMVGLLLTDPGGVIYCQTRVGKGGHEFTIYKFRSLKSKYCARRGSNPCMAPGLLLAAMRDRGMSEKDASLILAEFSENLTLKCDPRAGWFGACLRRTALDELPQLVNVLLGQMTLVGPRPITWAELDRYSEVERALLLSIEPGMTGLWQVCGRAGMPYRARINVETSYVERRNWRLDWLIVYRTAVMILGLKGHSGAA